MAEHHPHGRPLRRSLTELSLGHAAPKDPRDALRNLKRPILVACTWTTLPVMRYV